MITEKEHTEALSICKSKKPTLYEKRRLIRIHIKMFYDLEAKGIFEYDYDKVENKFQEVKNYFLNTKIECS